MAREVVLFCEDSFHEIFLCALLDRLATENQTPICTRVLSARGGLPRMHHEFGRFLRDASIQFQRSGHSIPDAILVAVDANCLGFVERRNQMIRVAQSLPAFHPLIAYAIPDPHVERWMLADPIAFKAVFGRGCTKPAVKCEKDLYKRLLREEIQKTGTDAPLGGEEFAGAIVEKMNLRKVERHEPSLGHLLQHLKGLFNRWKSGS